ncbi:MAG: hypothetical protein WC551_01885 [Patescibacteria group bacterium]
MSEELGKGYVGHGAIVRLLESALANPAPAYLFAGQMHLGKRTLAERFVRRLLGLEIGDAYLSAHPDVVVLEPEEGKNQVSVEQVRSLRERVSMRPVRAKRLVIYLPFADRLNESGMNALLKVIEEPPADAVFVFVAEDIGRVPLTVRSRSVVIPFETVPAQTIIQALIASGVSEVEAKARALSSRGRPGLAIDSSMVTAGGSVFVRQFLMAKTVGARLSFIDELAKACDSSADVQGAWRESILSAMQETSGNIIRDPYRASVFGIALLTALHSVGSPVSPRLALEACAVRLGQDAAADLPSLFPGHLPKSMARIYLEPQNI